MRKIIIALLPKKVLEILRRIRRRMQIILGQGIFTTPSRLGIVSVGGFDIAYRKKTYDEYGIAMSFDHEVFLKNVPEYKLSENHVIIDIGAHIGGFTLHASSKVKRGKVFAIEACEETFNLLHINKLLNRADNLFVHHLAISDRRGTCELYYYEKDCGNSVVKNFSSKSETVNCCSLTDFLEDNQIEKCHYMKLNCEGAEFPILLSTPHNVLKRFEVVLVLYHGDLWEKNTETDLVSHFQDCGFDTTLRQQKGKRGWLIATNRSSENNISEK